MIPDEDNKKVQVCDLSPLYSDINVWPRDPKSEQTALAVFLRDAEASTRIGDADLSRRFLFELSRTFVTEQYKGEALNGLSVRSMLQTMVEHMRMLDSLGLLRSADQASSYRKLNTIVEEQDCILLEKHKKSISALSEADAFFDMYEGIKE